MILGEEKHSGEMFDVHELVFSNSFIPMMLDVALVNLCNQIWLLMCRYSAVYFLTVSITFFFFCIFID